MLSSFPLFLARLTSKQDACCHEEHAEHDTGRMQLQNTNLLPTPLFNRLYPFRHAASGNVLLNVNDMHMTPAVALTGEYSEEEVDVFRACLVQDAVICEVGACFGLHTIVLAELARGGRVLAFEPQPPNYHVLVANLALNAIRNVDARCQAVGREAAWTKLPVLDPAKPNNFGQMAALGHTEGTATEVLALDNIAFSRLDFLKIDCEGNELDVLEGARATIQALNPRIYMEFTENRAAILAYLASVGYVAKRHMPTHTRTPNFLAADLSTYPTYGSDMILAWPNTWPVPDFPSNWSDPTDTDILASNPTGDCDYRGAAQSDSREPISA